MTSNTTYILCLQVGVDDVDEGWLQAGTANQEAIDISLLAELLAVLLADTAAVQDAGLVGSLVVNVLLQPLADSSVDLLGLLGGGDLAGADGPDGLVGDDDLGPVRADLGLEGGELLGDDVDGLAGLTLLERLATAPDDADAVVGGVLGLGGNDLVGLVEDCSALAVAQDGPGGTGVLELLDGDLTGVGTVGLVVDVLGGDRNLLGQGLADCLQVKGWWGDDGLSVRVQSGVVQYR